jgi:hypothetical protein
MTHLFARDSLEMHGVGEHVVVLVAAERVVADPLRQRVRRRLRNMRTPNITITIYTHNYY